MSTTAISEGTEVINQPKSHTTNLISDLMHLSDQGHEYAVGDSQVQGGGKKTFKIKQIGGQKKHFTIKASNQKNAATHAFLKMQGKGAIYTVNGRLYQGSRVKKGKRYYNKIKEF